MNAIDNAWWCKWTLIAMAYMAIVGGLVSYGYYRLVRWWRDE